MKIDDLFTNDLPKWIYHLKEKTLNEIQPLLHDFEISNRTGYFCITEKKYNKIIDRVFAIKLDKKKNEILCKEVIRRVEGCKNIIIRDIYLSSYAGCITVWDIKKNSTYYFYEDNFGKWYSTDRKYYKIWCYFITNINNFCEYLKFDNNERYHNIPLSDLITIYRKYPSLEILFKIKRLDLISIQCLEKLQNDKKFRKFIFKNKDRLYSFKKLYYLYKNNISMEDYIIIKSLGKENIKLLNIKKVINYMRDKMDQLNLYIDMIEAAKKLGIDLNLYPKNLVEKHDEIITMLDTKNNAEINEKIKMVKNKYIKLEKNIDNIYFKLPETKGNLIIEGDKMHHCVGKMNYDQKIAKEESLIVFVRDENDNSLATIEYDFKHKKILQCYSKYNKKPEASLQLIIDSWYSKIKNVRKINI